MNRIKDPVALLKACGSLNGGWDPAAPAQTVCRMNNKRIAASERLIAWAELHTLGENHKLPFCCDAQSGRALWLKDIEAHFEWAQSTCRHVLAECCQQGRLRADFKAKRIYYMAVVVPDETIQVDWEEGEQTAKLFALYRAISEELPSFINDLEEEEKKKTMAILTPQVLWKQRIEVDSAAAARYATEPHVAKVLQFIGFRKKAKGHRQPTRIKPIELLELPPPFPEEEESSVQGKPDNAPVIDGPIRTTTAMGLCKPAETPVRTASLLGKSEQQNKLEATPSLPLGYAPEIQAAPPQQAGIPRDSGLASSSSSSSVNVERPPVQSPAPPSAQRSDEKQESALSEDGRAAHSEKSGDPDSLNELGFASELDRICLLTKSRALLNPEQKAHALKLIRTHKRVGTTEEERGECRAAYIRYAEPRVQARQGVRGWDGPGALLPDLEGFLHAWQTYRVQMRLEKIPIRDYATWLEHVHPHAKRLESQRNIAAMEWEQFHTFAQDNDLDMRDGPPFAAAWRSFLAFQQSEVHPGESV